MNGFLRLSCHENVYKLDWTVTHLTKIEQKTKYKMMDAINGLVIEQISNCYG